MGRGRGKGKKQCVGARDNNVSGEDDKLPVRRRGRPQKPFKDEIDDEGKVVNLEEEEDDDEDHQTATENSRKRKRPSQVKENADLVINAQKTNANDLIKSVGYRSNGSRRKNKPRRAAEVGFECI